MELSLANTPLVIGTALALLIIAVHTVSIFFLPKLSRLLSVTAILMHLPLSVLFLLAGAELDFLVLIFMASTLVYTALSFVKSKLDGTEQSEEGKEGES